MHVPDAGSVMIDNVRFGRRRILRRARTTFACMRAGVREGAGLRREYQVVDAKASRGFVTHFRRNHAGNKDDLRPKEKKHHKLVRTLQGY
jgi:hypothetical protein